MEEKTDLQEDIFLIWLTNILYLTVILFRIFSSKFDLKQYLPIPFILDKNILLFAGILLFFFFIKNRDKILNKDRGNIKKFKINYYILLAFPDILVFLAVTEYQTNRANNFAWILLTLAIIGFGALFPTKNLIYPKKKIELPFE